MVKNALKFTSRLLNCLSWLAFSNKHKPDKIGRVLIVNLGFIGDVIAITPLIEVLSRKYAVDMAVSMAGKEILQHSKAKNIVVYSEKDFLKEISGKYDASIMIYPNSGKIANDLIKAGIKFRISSMPSSPMLRYTTKFSRITPKFTENNHKVIQNLEYAKYFEINLGQISPKSNPMILKLTKNEISMTKGKFKLKDFVIMSPGSRSQIKMGVKLPETSKFSAVADYLIERYHKKVILTGSKSEFSLCEEIRKNSKHSKQIINLAGKTTIRELACLTKLSSLVIGVDSGTIHIAASQNAKIIDLIRNSQKKIWYPWTNPANYRLLVSKDKSLNRVSVEDIKKAINELLT